MRNAQLLSIYELLFVVYLEKWLVDTQIRRCRDR